MYLPRQNSNVGLEVLSVALDVADEDDVVAAIMPVLVAALEMRRCADQHRRAAFRDHVVDLGEFVLVRPGKFIGELDLVVRQAMSVFFTGGTAGSWVERAESQRFTDSDERTGVGDFYNRARVDLSPGV
jgi:hypothetical protein